MNYWLSIFDRNTWEQFQHRESKLCAFPESRFRRFPNIEVGDRFLCYVSKAQVWVACLEVVGERFTDTTRIFDGGIFPIRFPVRPESIVNIDEGVPMESLAGRLSFFPLGGTGKDWAPYVRNAARRYSDADAKVIVAAIRKRQASIQ